MESGQAKKPAKPKDKKADHPSLGLSTDDLANVTVDELLQNAVAIRMLLHRYREVLEEKTGLEHQAKLDASFQGDYRDKKTYGRVSGGLGVLSNGLIGFGTNLVTSGSVGGWILLSSGVVVGVAALYYSWRD